MKSHRTVFLILSLAIPCLAVQGQPAQHPAESRGRASAVPRLVKYVGQAFLPVRSKQAAAGAEAGHAGVPVLQASVTFAIYAEAEGGAALWQETQNVALDADGRYGVLLGAASRDGIPAELFATGEPRWLGVRVNAPGEAEGSSEQARVLLVSVPYALRAADADSLGGRAATDFVLREELAGWSGVAAGAADAPRAVGGTQGIAVDATGTVGRVPRVLSATGSLITYTDGLFFDDGNGVGLGTTTPVALLDLQLTTAVPRDTLSAAVTLNNSAPIPGAVVTPFRMTLNDQSTDTNLSKQAMRVIYNRDTGATGGVTVFDSAVTLASFFRSNAPYTYRVLNIEGPRIFNGQTLQTLFGIFIEAPPPNVAGQPAGTITNKFAIVTSPGSGNVGIGTTAPSDLLEVSGGNIRLTGLGNAIIFPDGSVMSSAAGGVGGGTITGVTAGAGLSGGGTSGGVTLAADTNFLQRRVTGLCASGSSISSIASDGTVTCEPDDTGTGTGTVTSIAAGTGLTATPGSPITTSGTLDANFTTSGGNNGVATTVARGDHLHDNRYGRLGFPNTFTSPNTFSGGVFANVTGTGNTALTATNDDVLTGTGTAAFFNNTAGGKVLVLESGGQSILTADSLGLHFGEAPFYVDVGNSTTPGTILNRLVKFSPTGASVASAGETGGAIGIVIADAGTSPAVPESKVAIIGTAQCEFDNAAVFADYVQISATVAGQCHSAGATFPSSGQVMGRVVDLGGPLPIVYLFGTETRGAAPNILTIAANSFVTDPAPNGVTSLGPNNGQRSASNGLLLNPPTSSFANAALPHGAVVTGFRACGRDNDTTANLNFTFTLKRKLLVTNTGNAFIVPAEDVATAGSTDVTNSGDTLCHIASVLSNVVIDNGTYFYFVVLTTGGTTVEPAAVVIEYR